MYSRNFYNKNLKGVSRELRNHMTFSEKKLWQQFLRTFKPRVHRQRPLNNFVADFYIPKAKLVIEVDGEIHNDEKAIAKDMDRTMILIQSDIKVIRFKNEDVMKNFSFVCEVITKEVSLRMNSKYGKPPLLEGVTQRSWAGGVISFDMTTRSDQFYL